MASQAGDLIDSIARRVRDPNNTAHSRSLVRDLLDRAQVVVNGAAKSIKTEENLATTAGQAVYSVESDLTATTLVLSVLHNERHLSRIVPWRNLNKLSSTWLQDDQSEPFGWANIGRDLFAIYPAPTEPAPTVKTVGIKRTNELTDDTTSLELDEEKESIAMDLVTTMLLVRQRDLDQVATLVQKVGENLGIQLVPET